MSDPAAQPVCDYCGLPVARPWWGGDAAYGSASPQYCCFGCRFAAAVTRSRGEEGAATWALTRLGVAVFLTMNVMVFTMALWTQDFYGAEASAPFRNLFRSLSLLLALPVLLLLGGPLLENAWDALRRGELATDLLLLIGVAASYVYSVVSVVREDGPVYFEVGCMVLVLVTLGRWLEATGKLRTGAAIEALARLLPEQARVLRPTEMMIPLNEVKVGDTLRVLPGERIPCDGRVVQNTAAVDEQVLTGESQPAVKGPGDRVHSGTLNLDGDLMMEATAPPSAGALARLIALVREARQSRGRYERLADRIAAGFLPGVTLLALLAFGWHAWHGGLDQGILVGLAVLLIACPCALGLATPMAVWAALGQAARAQVLFRNGEALEQLAAVRAVRLDKTGTLTTGTPEVALFAVADQAERCAVLSAAAALASASSHAHAVAIRNYAAGRLTGPPERLNGARSVPGRGVAGHRESDGEAVYLGSVGWLDGLGLAPPEALSCVIREAIDSGHALTCVGWGGVLRGVFVLREQLRPEAAAAIAELRQLGLDIGVLTGDHAARGRALGDELGVAVEAGQLPEDKVAAVRRARETIGPVAMVGDGINDAPALAAADVGLAMGCGADLAREAAPVCLLGNELRRLPWTVALARQTVRVIRRNLFWAFFYNVLGVGFACTGKLNPVLASLAMVLSSLFVVSNSLRLAGPSEEPVT